MSRHDAAPAHRYHLAECVDRGPDVPRENRFAAKIVRDDNGETCLRAFASERDARAWADRAEEHLDRERKDRMADTFWGRGIHS